MFELEDKLCFINVEMNYLKELHNVCPEVYYRENDYENKLFMGILVSKENRKYVIPLSSAKEKHKSWRDVDKDRYLVFEYAKEENMKRNDVWMSLDESVADKGDNNVKHILAAMDIKKMMPIKEDIYSMVDFNTNDSDDEKMIRYKDLLNKEYAFCIKIIEGVIEKANKIYDKQIRTEKVQKFCCDFKKLEQVCDTYIID